MDSNVQAQQPTVDTAAALQAQQNAAREADTPDTLADEIARVREQSPQVADLLTHLAWIAHKYYANDLPPKSA